MDFKQLKSEDLKDWLCRHGFFDVTREFPEVLSSGEVFLQKSIDELTNLLHIREYFAKKRLKVWKEALSQGVFPAGHKLNSEWILLWLDRIGLSSYKYSFQKCHIDGVLLNFITEMELDRLKIYTPFHKVSLMRAIQYLRMTNFSKCTLKNHFTEESPPKELIMWSSFDLENWLLDNKLINTDTKLDNVGLHGALIVLEPNFNFRVFGKLLLPIEQDKRRQNILKEAFHNLVPKNNNITVQKTNNLSEYQDILATFPYSEKNDDDKPLAQIEEFSNKNTKFICCIHNK